MHVVLSLWLLSNRRIHDKNMIPPNFHFQEPEDKLNINQSIPQSLSFPWYHLPLDRHSQLKTHLRFHLLFPPCLHTLLSLIDLRAIVQSLFMALSDAVIGNLTTIYVAVIAGIKAYGLVCGRSFSGVFVLIVSTAVVGLILIGTLTWDISRKAMYAISQDRVNNVHEMCKGGICWHGVAVRSPASQVRFRLPQR